MKVAVLSDIHGNDYALGAVLNQFSSDIEEIWILGDLVGYYYDIKGVLDRLKRSNLPLRMIRGNHEVALKLALSSKDVRNDYLEKYGSSLEFAIQTLSPEEIHALVNLPDTLTPIRGVLLSHGSPWNPDEYVYQNAEKSKLQRFSNYHEDIFFLGHTHYPMNLNLDGKRIINPGSVGQQRNGIRGAHWGIFDTQSKTYQQICTPYDESKLILDVNRIDPKIEYLHKILLREA